MKKDEDFGLGSFDHSSIHQPNIPFNNHRNQESYRHITEPFPDDYGNLYQPIGQGYHPYSDELGDEIYIEDFKAIEPIIKATIAGLTEEEKYKALVEYYKSKLQSESTKQKLEERKVRIETKKRFHEWSKYILLIFTFLFIITLIVIVGTIVFTSLQTGQMTETGIFTGILAFVGEILKTLLLSN